MPVIYLSKALYDRLILLGEDPSAYVIKAAEDKLNKERNGKGEPQPQKAG